jgi:hypothetical protein
MTLTEQLIQTFEPISAVAVKAAFEDKLMSMDIDNITVEDVVVDYEGDITVAFSDDEGGLVEILFTYDPEEGAIAILLDDIDSEEFTIIDLDSLAPPLKQTLFGPYMDLTNLEWLNSSVLNTLFRAPELVGDEDEFEETASGQVNADKHGYIGWESFEVYEDESVDEGRKIAVVRGGKRVRLAVVKKVRRKILTGKMKSSIRKAVRKRKAKMAKILRKRKRSLKVRKRQGVKTPKLTRFQKIAGTANRKR